MKCSQVDRKVPEWSEVLEVAPIHKKPGNDTKVSSAKAHKLHICYATTQVYLGNLQRDLVINNEWLAPVSEWAGLIVITRSQRVHL